MLDLFKLKRNKDGAEFPINELSCLVGRSDSCHISIDSPSMSREHARVRLQNGKLLLQDLHSTNGTCVNDKDIDEETAVKPGDVIKFGDEVFSVLSQQQENATVFMRSIDTNKSAFVSSMDDEDEDDLNATSVLQAYVMPPGWGDFDNTEDSALSIDEKKQDAINNYLVKASQAMSGKTGAAFIFFFDKKPPTIKVLSSTENSKTWSFGRDRECDLFYDNPAISLHHADISFNNACWEMKDCQSTNGLWLNKTKKTTFALQDNTTVQVGDVKINIRLLKKP